MSLHLSVRRLAIPISALALVAGLAASSAGQTPGGDVEGVIRDARTGAPLAGADVTMVGTGRFAVTHGDGTFHIHGLAHGAYTLRVRRLGYGDRTLEVQVGDGTAGTEEAPLVIELSPSPLAMAELVVTGAITERGAAEAIRPVNVLAGEEFQRRLAETVASTLASEPGLSSTSMGPATARPVIRGMSGDRVLMLEDGQRVGDVSSSGADHATALDPSTARRIEVVRGPGALLYGSNALGGVVNVIRDEIPTEVSHHFTGAATLQTRTINDGYGGSFQGRIPVTDHVPLRIELSGRTASDLHTPIGSLENTHLDTWALGAGSAWVDEWGSAGAAFRLFKNDYGIPGGFVGGHAQGVRVDMLRTSSKALLNWDRPVGPFENVQVDATHTWYRHEEIEPPDILGTLFQRNLVSSDALARHAAWGPFSAGAAGARLSWEQQEFGGSLFTPDTRRYTAAVYLFEEIEFGAVTAEAGLRYDFAHSDPLEEDPDSDIGNIRARTFHAASGSVGMLYRTESGVSLGVSVARAFRTPDVNELYSEGPHLAAYSFEVGNPDLDTETGTGVDGFVRVVNDRVQAEFTGFYNRLGGYIFPVETGDTSRVRLPVFQYRGDDAKLLGFEGQLEWGVLPDLVLEATTSYVRGTLTAADEPLPLIPPWQSRVAVEYERPGGFVRAESTLTSEQDRLGPFEETTDGYAIYSLGAGLRRTVGGRLNVLTVTLDNLTDEVYRNHLSRVKSIMPEAGRGLSVTYRVVF